MGDEAATVAQLRAEVRRPREQREADRAEVDFWRQRDDATTEVLRAVAASPVDFGRVLDMLGRRALSEAGRVSVQLRDGDHLMTVNSAGGVLASRPGSFRVHSRRSLKR
jgi:hypothetical protein